MTEIAIDSAQPVSIRPEGGRRAAPVRRRSFARLAAKIGVWIVGVPAFLFLCLYVALLFGPMPLPFVADQARAAVLRSMPQGYGLQLGDTALALEGGSWPVIQFSPVILTDTTSGARVEMEALEVGFSPIRAIIGQPGASVTLVGPRIQVVQDLFGPRLASFEVVEDPNGGEPTVRVLEGTTAFPRIGISIDGLQLEGAPPIGFEGGLRSDNDWLIYNFEAAEAGLADVVKQAQAGVFSRMVMRDGVVEMTDSVYGQLRRFNNIALDLRPSADGRQMTGTFSASMGNATMTGTLERVVGEDGVARLITNGGGLDIPELLAGVGSEAGLELAGSVAFNSEMTFEPGTTKVTQGIFGIEMSGVEVKLGNDTVPFSTTPMQVVWTPSTGQFEISDTEYRLGESSGRFAGVMALGLDEIFGPTVGIQLTASDLMIQPGDLPVPETLFDRLTFEGWSAPLYGATGIDQLVLTRDNGARLAARGRVDMVRWGMGVDLTVGAEGFSAEDLKRIWPTFAIPDGRQWFVQNVLSGQIDTASMRINLPVGVLPQDGSLPTEMPPNSLSLDMTGTGISVVPMAGMEPIHVDGQTRVQLRNMDLTVSAAGGRLDTPTGPIVVTNPAFQLETGLEGQSLVEISGSIRSGLPSLIALAKQTQPDFFAEQTIPIDLDQVVGELNTSLVTTIALNGTEIADIDYAVTGTVTGLGSNAPVQGFTFGGADLSFNVNQDAYTVLGEATVQDVTANLRVAGVMAPEPTVEFTADVNAEDFSKFGVDVSDYIGGMLRISGRPTDTGIDLEVDLDNARLTVADLGITKAVGENGSLSASLIQTGDVATISNLDLAFGDVALEGGIVFDLESNELRSADFSRVQISEGDSARLSLAPIDGGYSLRVRGEQLDLKPMLGRFFSLGGSGGAGGAVPEPGTGGVQVTATNETIVLDIELDRAVGFYRTTAYDVDIDLAVRGTDLRRVAMSAQLGNGRSISVTTNPSNTGRVMSVAFNDLGTLLRLVGVYPRFVGGEGSFVLDTNTEADVSSGTILLRNFAIVNEENVAQVVGNQQETRALLGSQTEYSFESAKVDFIMRSDRIQITEGILSGDDIGGTARGFIYTTARQYDLTGTFVPLSGINTLFQRLPIFGELLGGRDGEGLIGVTFAVRGPLDQPEFLVNPASILAVGAFRSLFEFRSQEQPRPN